MLLTGFDAPIEQVMYLDKPVREHGLLQAIARVNRRFSRHVDGVTIEKEYGLIVDYYGVSNELEAALSEFDPRDVQSSLEPLEDNPEVVIESAAAQAEAFFRGKSLDNAWECVEVFVDPATTELRVDLFEKFDAAYKDFAGLMDRYLPSAGALAYTDRLTRLTRIRSYVRAQFLRENADVDWSGVSMKVKQLLDSRIDAEVRELMKPISILDANFQEKISQLPHDEARASVMEHAIRAQVKERIGENPAFYEKLSQQLQRIIDEMKQRLIDAAEACRRMMQLKQTALGEAQAAADQGLSELSFALYELLEQSTNGEPATSDGEARVGEQQQPAYRTVFNDGLKASALRIEEIMRKGQSIIDWYSNEDVQREMRRDIKRELRALDGRPEEEIEDLARSMVDIARRKAARG